MKSFMQTAITDTELAFNIYYHDKCNLGEFESKKVFTFQHFSFYEHLKFHAQWS